MSDDAEKAMQDLSDVSDRFNSVMKLIEQEQEEYWNSLSKEQQLKAFCAVARRIHQAELVDMGSYRHTLYGVFGFGPESYGQAQLAGYLAIHNSIFTAEHEQDTMKAFARAVGVDEAKVDEFLRGKYL
jgi:hypothetical protein